MTNQQDNDALTIAAPHFIGLLMEMEHQARELIATTDKSAEELRILLLGPKSELGKLTKQIRQVPPVDRGNVGVVVNEVKESIEKALQKKLSAISDQLSAPNDWFDVTAPGIRPPEGHLHIVSQAITEITRIFERIGFTRKWTGTGTHSNPSTCRLTTRHGTNGRHFSLTTPANLQPQGQTLSVKSK